MEESEHQIAIDRVRIGRNDVFGHASRVYCRAAAMTLPIVVDSALSFIGLVFIAAGLIVFAVGSRTADFATFEARSILARRLIAAAFFPLALELIGTGTLGGVGVVAVVGLWSASWLPKRRRRFEYGVEAIFRSPPESVAAVMFDVSAQPRWMESVRDAALETPGLLRVGSVIRQRVAVQGRQLVARLRVVELEPYQRLVLALEAVSPPPIDILEVSPQGVGARVIYRGSQQLPMLVAILAGWRLGSLRRRFERQRAASLERLRGLVDPRARLA
jgi:hypothetical protein